MSVVLSVNYLTGEYSYLCADGNVIKAFEHEPQMSDREADVLIERIRQGYAHVPAGYILRVRRNVHNRNEVTELLFRGMDDDGYPEWSDWGVMTNVIPGSALPGIGLRVAAMDPTQGSVVWLSNPLADNPFVTDPRQAAFVACKEPTKLSILVDSHTMFENKNGGNPHFMMIPFLKD